MISIMASNNAQLIEKTEILCKKTLRGKIMTYLEQEAKNVTVLLNLKYLLTERIWPIIWMLTAVL